MKPNVPTAPHSPTRVSPRDIAKASYGRDFGWFMERDGVVIGQLTDWRFEDMFWCSYAVEPLGDTEEQRRVVYDPSTWQAYPLTFRNRVTGDVATDAIASGTPSEGQPRVNMRFLYLRPQLSWYERLQLWWWMRQRTRER